MEGHSQARSLKLLRIFLADTSNIDEHVLGGRQTYQEQLLMEVVQLDNEEMQAGVKIRLN